MKWASEADPTWEPIEFIEDTEALDRFEECYGLIKKNDGPLEENAGKFVGQAEKNTMQKRHQQQKKINHSNAPQKWKGQCDS